MRFNGSILAALALALLTQAAVAQSSRLDVVKTRGMLRCGVTRISSGSRCLTPPDNGAVSTSICAVR